MSEILEEYGIGMLMAVTAAGVLGSLQLILSIVG